MNELIGGEVVFDEQGKRKMRKVAAGKEGDAATFLPPLPFVLFYLIGQQWHVRGCD